MPVQSTAEVQKDIGALVRHHREAAGLSQAQLAEKAGISVEFVGRIERGQNAATLATLAALADGTGVPLRALFSIETYQVGQPSKVLARIVRELARLDEADLIWAEKLLQAAINRKPRRRVGKEPHS